MISSGVSQKTVMNVLIGMPVCMPKIHDAGMPSIRSERTS
jgi:hypothetical protein